MNADDMNEPVFSARFIVPSASSKAVLAPHKHVNSRAQQPKALQIGHFPQCEDKLESFNSAGLGERQNQLLPR
jgi:hypothetical protein